VQIKRRHRLPSELQTSLLADDGYNTPSAITKQNEISDTPTTKTFPISADSHFNNIHISPKKALKASGEALLRKKTAKKL